MELSLSVLEGDSGIPVPLIVRFDSAPPEELLDPDRPIGVYRALKQSSQIQTTVIAETEKILFRGEIPKRNSTAEGTSLRCAVGVRDRRTGAVKLIRVADSVASLKRELRETAAESGDVDDDGNDVAGSRKPKENADTELTYAQRHEMLTDIFGSKRVKIRAKAIAASELPKVVLDVPQEQRETALSAAAAHIGENSDTYEDVPKFNPTAEKPEEAFVLADGVLTPLEHSIVAERAAFLIEVIPSGVDALMAYYTENEPSNSEYVGYVLPTLVSSKVSDARRMEKAVALMAYNYFVELTTVRSSGLQNDKMLAKSAEKRWLPADFLSSVVGRMFESGYSATYEKVTQNLKSEESMRRLINHALVLALSFEKWSISFDSSILIARDLKLEHSKCEQHLARIGCVRKAARVEGANGPKQIRYVLITPVKPSAAVHRGRRLGI